MMEAGNEGGEDRKGDKTLPESVKFELSVCDVSSDDFKKTWLKLKELHDKELHRLQAKLTSLRKERLSDGRWTGSTAKIKELTEQQKALNATIQALREQLRSKTCDRCSVNETYRSTLQQEFYDIQQRNLKLITEITAERNKLREENKILAEKLKLTQQKFSSSESDDEFIPCAQKTGSVFTVRDPTEGYQVTMPNTEQMKSGEKEQQQNPEFLIPLHSQDLFDMAETSFEDIPFNTSKPTTGGTSNQNSPISFPLIYTQSTQREHEFQVVSNLSEDKLGQAKKIQTLTHKTSTQRTSTQIDFPWSFSSFVTEQNPAIEVVSETSEENMPDNRFSLHSFTEKKETVSSNVFPFDYTSSRKRLSVGIPRYNIGFLERDGSCQIPSNEQLSLRKNTNESTVAKGYAADKPQDINQSPILGSRIKRKARIQSEKRK